ncbi:LAMI_0A06304g1_1 [Lachancea mirantina]|uniref:LAMI_0A06304g1_1 n=1 Tax=Lachancea mirantina TaxID=1230905 RepID=A0A1G4IQ34_9SACH|nr:LAMI_0A06304g1_1 [Lachancea mirantina]
MPIKAKVASKNPRGLVLSNIPANLEHARSRRNLKTDGITENANEHRKNFEEDQAIQNVPQKKCVSQVSQQVSDAEVSLLISIPAHESKNKVISRKVSDSSPMADSQHVTSLFVGDLASTVTEKDLAHLFRRYSSLVSVKVCRDSSGKETLGHGYANFAHEEEAKSAMNEFNYSQFFGKEIRLMPSMRNSYYRKNVGTNVFFSNLPLEKKELTTRIFYDTFKSYGSILSCKLDRRKNIGFVYFESGLAATKAIEDYNQREFFGSIISCGIHFDKLIRNSPEFSTRKAKLQGLTLQKEQLVPEDDPEVKRKHQHGISAHRNAVLVKNVCLSATTEMLLDYFSQFGPIKSVFLSKKLTQGSRDAMVTFKRGSDIKRAISTANDSKFLGRKIRVLKLIDRSSSEIKQLGFPNLSGPKSNEIDHTTSNGHQNEAIFLTNLSPICTEEFIACICRREGVHFNKILTKNMNTWGSALIGIVECKSQKDARKLFNVMNNRLIGDSFVRASFDVPMAKTSENGQTQENQDSSKPYKKGFFDPATSDSKFSNNNLKPSDGLNLTARYLDHGQPIIMGYKKGAKAEGFVRRRVIEVLQKKVSGMIDFLKSPVATREENLKCIAEYILEVYWRSDLDSLADFLLMMSTKPQNERILSKQVDEAVKLLGFQR